MCDNCVTSEARGQLQGGLSHVEFADETVQHGDLR